MTTTSKRQRTAKEKQQKGGSRIKRTGGGCVECLGDSPQGYSGLKHETEPKYQNVSCEGGLGPIRSQKFNLLMIRFATRQLKPFVWF